MNIYRGSRNPMAVWVEDESGKVRTLPMRLALVSHSPTGFEWGYGGSGPAQLALAILADCLGADRAMALFGAFKWEFVARWPEQWAIGEDEILAWAHRQERR